MSQYEKVKTVRSVIERKAARWVSNSRVYQGDLDAVQRGRYGSMMLISYETGAGRVIRAYNEGAGR